MEWFVEFWDGVITLKRQHSLASLDRQMPAPSGANE